MASLLDNLDDDDTEGMLDDLQQAGPSQGGGLLDPTQAPQVPMGLPATGVAGAGVAAPGAAPATAPTNVNDILASLKPNSQDRTNAIANALMQFGGQVMQAKKWQGGLQAGIGRGVQAGGQAYTGSLEQAQNDKYKQAIEARTLAGAQMDLQQRQADAARQQALQQALTPDAMEGLSPAMQAVLKNLPPDQAAKWLVAAQRNKQATEQTLYQQYKALGLSDEDAMHAVRIHVGLDPRAGTMSETPASFRFVQPQGGGPSFFYDPRNPSNQLPGPAAPGGAQVKLSATQQKELSTLQDALDKNSGYLDTIGNLRKQLVDANGQPLPASGAQAASNFPIIGAVIRKFDPKMGQLASSLQQAQGAYLASTIKGRIAGPELSAFQGVHGDQGYTPQSLLQIAGNNEGLARQQRARIVQRIQALTSGNAAGYGATEPAMTAPAGSPKVADPGDEYRARFGITGGQ